MRFPGKARVPAPNTGRRSQYWLAAALVLLLTSAGCWDKVPYDTAGRTAPSTATTPSGDSTPDSGADGGSDVGTAIEPQPDEEPAVPGPETPKVGEEADSQDVPPPIETAEPPVEPADPPIVIVVPTPPAPVDHTPTPVDRQRAWTLASDWGLAAAGYAKGFDADRYEPYLGTAGEAADALGIALPALPKAEDPGKLEAAVVEAFRTGVGAKLQSAIAERLDPAAGAAARLALDAHLLLLNYTPDGSTVWGDAVDIRDAGAASRLPPDLWRPLVELLERRADFVDVRTAVFALRNGVAKHLASQAAP